MAEAKMSNDPVAQQLREQFPSNSKVARPAEVDVKPERKAMQAVANGVVGKGDAKSIGKRILKLFIAEDVKDIKRYILEDVLVPGIKTTILSSLDRLFFARGSGYYGGFRPYDYTKAGRPSSVYYYGQKQPPKQSQTPRTEPPRTASGMKFITYVTRQEAETVLAEMNNRILEYGEVTLRDYYEASSIDSDFTDENWGWKNLHGAHCYPVRGGYAIELPPIQVLDS